MMKIFPWGLSFFLAGVCVFQQLEIRHLEEHKRLLEFETAKVPRGEIDAPSKRRLKRRHKNYKRDKSFKRGTLDPQQDERFEEGDQNLAQNRGDRDLENPDLEAEIEERAWVRVEEIEEERQNEHRERIRGYLKEQIQEWSTKFSWSEAQERAVQDLFLASMEARMELREQVHAGVMERSQMREHLQEQREQLFEDVRAWVDEEQAAEIEAELPRRWGRRP